MHNSRLLSIGYADKCFDWIRIYFGPWTALSRWAWQDLLGQSVCFGKLKLRTSGAGRSWKLKVVMVSSYGYSYRKKNVRESGKMEITQLLNISNTSKPGLSRGVPELEGSGSGSRRAFTTAEVPFPARFVTVSYLFWPKDLLA